MRKITDAKIMLLDAYSTRTLACVRSFGAHGIPFVVGGQSRWDMSFCSRHCKESFVYTSPNINIPHFLEDLNANVKKFAADIVLPTSEAAIIACALHRDEIDAELLAPSLEQIDILFQKSKTLELAKSVGVRIPATERINRETVDRLSKIDIPFPAIIKANSSESVQGDRVIRGGSTTYVYSRQELEEKARNRFSSSPEILVQAFINGYGVGISGIFRDGEPVALFGHRRIRESNPLGGPSAVAESIEIDDELYDSTVNIMRQTRYTGPAMIEYKVERKSGMPYLMEINGRLWGSILLPLAAGLDLPYIMWKVANSQEVKPSETTYKVGLIGRQLFGDTKHLATVLKGKPANWPGYFPGRWEAIRDYVSLFFSSQTQSLLLTSDDPKPAFGRLLQELLA